jgi:tetratricopeptide (TPR) repeat protein
VLEGSVQKAGDRVRITAQLIRADDGFHIWSQHYDRTLEDIFAIQDEIAADVAATLGSALFAANADAIQGVSTADISAYDIYLHALEQQAINTNEALVMAVELFEEALAKDPDFVDARTALARNYLLMTWKAVLNEEIALSEASALLAEALEQRPDDLVARELDLVVKFHNASARIDIPAADLLFEELLPLMDEGYGDAYVRRFAVQVLTGKERYPEALAALRDGLIVDPLNYDLLWAQATIFMATERPEEAMQPLLTALKVAPDNPLIYWRLGMAALNRGELVDALNWVREASEVDPGDPVLTLILADKFYTLGLLQEGDRWAERTRAIAPGSEAAIEADIWAAVARDDHAKLLDLTQQLIDREIGRAHV